MIKIGIKHQNTLLMLQVCDAIAEMVCDQSAVSQERGTSSTKEQADANINIRWKFTDEQIKWIYNFITDLEK